MLCKQSRRRSSSSLLCPSFESWDWSSCQCLGRGLAASALAPGAALEALPNFKSHPASEAIKAGTMVMVHPVSYGGQTFLPSQSQTLDTVTPYRGTGPGTGRRLREAVASTLRKATCVELHFTALDRAEFRPAFFLTFSGYPSRAVT